MKNASGRGIRCMLLVVQLLLGSHYASAQTYCRGDSNRNLNHMFSLWESDFPDLLNSNGTSLANNNDPPPALCEGTVAVDKDSGDICVMGRVTYGQLQTALHTAMVFQPAAQTVSVNGHLIAGSGNVVLGPKVHYLYDFITSYTINGETKQAGSDIVDDMLVASRGTIDGYCLDKRMATFDELWYEISHDVFELNQVDDIVDSMTNRDDIGLVFFGRFNNVIEYHTGLDAKPNSIGTTLRSWTIMNLVNYGLGFFPASLYGVIPVFAITGTSRLVVQGTYSTRTHPQPFVAPDNLGQVEGVQIDVPWDVLVTAIDNGLFTQDKVPLYFNVVIKRIEAEGINYKCWDKSGKHRKNEAGDDNINNDGTVLVASIDAEAPAGWGDRLDKFIDETIYPALHEYTDDIAIHFGKRAPPNSRILQSALDFYERCGVEIDLGQDIKAKECYHPICDRTNNENGPREFTYPSRYYDYDEE